MTFIKPKRYDIRVNYSVDTTFVWAIWWSFCIKTYASSPSYSSSTPKNFDNPSNFEWFLVFFKKEERHVVRGMHFLIIFLRVYVLQMYVFVGYLNPMLVFENTTDFPSPTVKASIVWNMNVKTYYFEKFWVKLAMRTCVFVDGNKNKTSRFKFPPICPNNGITLA